jgi:hypothetical protein
MYCTVLLVLYFLTPVLPLGSHAYIHNGRFTRKQQKTVNTALDRYHLYVVLQPIGIRRIGPNSAQIDSS